MTSSRHLLGSHLCRHTNPIAGFRSKLQSVWLIRSYTPRCSVGLLMLAAGFETLLSLGTSHQGSRLTQLHTESTTRPEIGANGSQTSSTVSQATSTKGSSPERQALSASRQPGVLRGQESSAVLTPSPANSVGPRETLCSSGTAHLSRQTNRQPTSKGVECSPVTTSNSAKPMGNADTGQVLSTGEERHLFPAATAQGSADSIQASSPEAAKWQSSAQPFDIPGRGQRALSPVKDKGLLPSQPMGSAGANRQILSPCRDRGISPAKLTDLQKQNDALQFKLQVLSVYIQCALCLTMREDLHDMHIV